MLSATKGLYSTFQTQISQCDVAHLWCVL